MIFFLACGCVSVGAQEPRFAHPGSFYTTSQFSETGESPARRQIVELAPTLASTPPEAPADFDVPAYAGKDSEQQRRVKAFQAQVRSAYVNALASRLAPDPAAAEATRRVILAWARTNKSVSGKDGPVVMNYLGVGLLVAADVVWDSFRPEERAAVQAWTREVFLRQAVAPEMRLHRNNHQSWAIFAGLVAACVVEDADLFSSYCRLLEAHVRASIEPDGAMPLELVRDTRAGWYSYFALAPILAAAQVMQNVTGEQIWDRYDRRIEKALDHLYHTFSDPDRLGAGSGVNPENLFEAAAGVYPRGPWAQAEYVRRARPIDASDDQHVAWEFPTAFPARRLAAPAAAELKQ